MTTQHQEEQMSAAPTERQEERPKDASAPQEQLTTHLPEAELKAAKPPKGMSKEDQQRMTEEAGQIIREIEEAEGGQELELADKVANVGGRTQQRASTELSLFQEKIGRLTRSGDDATGKQIAADIEELEKALNRINPSSLEKGFWFKILGVIPIFGQRMVRALKQAVKNRQTVAEFLEYIEESLRQGKEMLLRDNAELAVLYKQLEGHQQTIRQNSYFAELLWKNLDEAIERAQDLQKKGRLQNVRFRVSIRAQDLRAMEEAYEQFFVSITTTREANHLLIGTIDRMLTLGTNLVTVALAIAVALARQQDAIEAVSGTREFIGKQLQGNARRLSEQVRAIGDLYKDPVVAMKALEQAHNDLIKAMDEYTRIKIEAVERARANIDRLKSMSEELRLKREGAEVVEQSSLDVDDLPTRPTEKRERPKI